jgi:hypothetical protein
VLDSLTVHDDELMKLKNAIEQVARRKAEPQRLVTVEPLAHDAGMRTTPEIASTGVALNLCRSSPDLIDGHRHHYDLLFLCGLTSPSGRGRIVH